MLYEQVKVRTLFHFINSPFTCFSLLRNILLPNAALILVIQLALHPNPSILAMELVPDGDLSTKTNRDADASLDTNAVMEIVPLLMFLLAGKRQLLSHKKVRLVVNSSPFR